MGSKFVERMDETLLSLLGKGVLLINDEIDDETSEYVDTTIHLARASGSPKIKVIINSGGGCLHSSLIIHDIFNSYEGGVTGIVIGKAMSGANLILQGCQTRIATFGSVLMVHEMITTEKLNVLRDKKKFQELLEDLLRWQNKIYLIYQKRTGKTRQELRKIFEKEKMFSAEEALKLGFIDKVVDAAEIITKPNEEISQEIVLDAEQFQKLFGKPPNK